MRKVVFNQVLIDSAAVESSQPFNCQEKKSREWWGTVTRFPQAKGVLIVVMSLFIEGLSCLLYGCLLLYCVPLGLRLSGG